MVMNYRVSTENVFNIDSEFLAIMVGHYSIYPATQGALVAKYFW
jgi:hypothetical protein